MNKCPVCENTIGFVFGTCVNCGYNHIEKKYKRITVSVEDLERYFGKYHPFVMNLIDKHDEFKRR